MSIPVAKQYIKDFEKLGFGVFVHFGLYSFLERGEWAAHILKDKIDTDEYRKLTEKFNPDSMEKMVADISKSGAKYITLTTRHHDGFSLYDTCGLSDFDVMHSAAGRDLIREFVDACRKYDIVPFLYHTTFDWWHPDFEGDFEKYLEYLRESVKILCTNYGKIGGVWFDGNWSKQGDVWQEDKLYGMIRSLQPDAMIINNTGLSKHGEGSAYEEIDSVTFERGKAFPLDREGQKKYLAAEVCDSVNMHWGIADDINFKSPKTIIEALCRNRGAGANYLFNVGPDAMGHIPSFPNAMLEVIGKWMGLFGEAIYEGRPYWYSLDVKNFIMKSDKKAYIFCFDLLRKGSANVTYLSGSEGDFIFENCDLKIENLHWMDNGEKLDFASENGNLRVNFSGYDYGMDYCVRVACADLV